MTNTNNEWQKKLREDISYLITSKSDGKGNLVDFSWSDFITQVIDVVSPVLTQKDKEKEEVVRMVKIFIEMENGEDSDYSTGKSAAYEDVLKLLENK